MLKSCVLTRKFPNFCEKLKLLTVCKMMDHSESSCGVSNTFDEGNDLLSKKRCLEYGKEEVIFDSSSCSMIEHPRRKLPCIKRRKPANNLNIFSNIKQKSEKYNENETEYYYENGFRKVRPYFFTFNTFCKGRWLGKTLRDVYKKEFAFYSIEYYERARISGKLLLNRKPVDSLDVELKNNDFISSSFHRHEGDVLGADIKIIHEDGHYLVVDKPCSIPIHPTGRYRYNTLCYILKKDFGYENLHGCHRIDRLTSGIVIFAKTKHFASKIISEIHDRKVEKEYICKVVGEFPSTESPDGIVCKQPITQFNRKFGCCAAWKIDGFESKDACTHFHRISTDGKTSVVLCKPKTGRTHQIRAHLQYLGFPITNDPMYNHEAWGEDRFKHGPCSKSIDDVSSAISRTYLDDPVNAVASRKAKTISVNEEDNVISNNPHFSLDCLECLNPLPEPQMKWMIMYLHAFRYKGIDWEFKTELPEWTNQDNTI